MRNEQEKRLADAVYLMCARVSELKYELAELEKIGLSQLPEDYDESQFEHPGDE